MHIVLLAALIACSTDDGETGKQPDSGAAPSPLRVVTFGDVHGDAGAAREALQLAGVLDSADQWIGGETVVVQVGDQLDRGDDEREILDLFEVLRTQAAAAGGAFHPLLGNHEVMNVELDLRYVTQGGFDDFADISYDTSDSLVMSYPSDERGRVAAFRPGGEYAMLLSGHQIAVQVEDTLFVHGGLLPEHIEYGIDNINAETQAWMRGEAREPAILQDADAPTWSRHYSDETTARDCALLEEALDLAGAARMVVAHTVQDEGINAHCDDMVWRVDVGLAAHYGGSTEALEIVDGVLTVLD